MTDFLICCRPARINRTIHILGCYSNWVDVADSDSKRANWYNLEFPKFYLNNYFENIRQLIKYFFFFVEQFWGFYVIFGYLYCHFAFSFFIETMEIQGLMKKKEKKKPTTISLRQTKSVYLLFRTGNNLSLWFYSFSLYTRWSSHFLFRFFLLDLRLLKKIYFDWRAVVLENVAFQPYAYLLKL